jgi:putative ABC transport system ATP-binding protein
MGIIARLSQERGTTVVYVTHDPRMARYATRLIEIRDGRILDGDEAKADPPAGTSPAVEEGSPVVSR